jgi:pyroglutamyl-peptidase
MPRLLLTSFEPFGGHGLNSSLEVGRALVARPPHGADLTWLVLPVVAWECVERAWGQVEQLAPDVVLALGQAAGASAVRLEARAINLNHFSSPDNAGNWPRFQWIVSGGPSAYRATLPLVRVEAALQGRVPVETSFHAGTYVCNHLFYGLLHRAARHERPPKVGFLHLPLLPGQLRRGDRWPSCELSVLVEGVRRAVEACVGA